MALLEQLEVGGGAPVDLLVPLVYEQLHALAHAQLLRERAGHTLNTTALVHEAYIRLVDDTRVARSGRAYFFGAAARAMRQVLIDYARRRTRMKRGGGAAHLTLGDAVDDVTAADRLADQLIDLDRALDELAALNPRQARVVECRFFGGLAIDETAAALGVSPRTVRYDWAFARAWLLVALDGDEHELPYRPGAARLGCERDGQPAAS